MDTPTPTVPTLQGDTPAAGESALVPREPTPAMLDAGRIPGWDDPEHEGSCIGHPETRADIYRAMIAAAPVHVTDAGDDGAIYISANAYAAVVSHDDDLTEIAATRAPFDAYTVRLVPALAAAPVASPVRTDADGVREALKQARQFIANGIELGFIRMPDASTPDPAHGTLDLIDLALSKTDGETGPAVAGNPLRMPLENLAREMRAMLRANPKKDGGLYRQRLTEAEEALAALKPEKEIGSAVADAEQEDTEATWMDLALQFDGQRILAMQLLRAMVAEPGKWQEEAAEFVKAPPLSGEQVLADRIAALTVSPSPSERDAEQFIQVEIDTASAPLQRLGKWLANKLDEDDWKTAEKLLLGAVVLQSEERARIARDLQAPSERDQHQREALREALARPTMERRLLVMAENYRLGHSWDGLDEETVRQAAWEIAHLRAALSPEPHPVADKREGDTNV